MKTLAITLLSMLALLCSGARVSGEPDSPGACIREAKPRIKVEGAGALQIGMFPSEETLKKIASLYSNREFRANKQFPALLQGKFYYELAVDKPHRYECVDAGEIFALTPVNELENRSGEVETFGFTSVEGVDPFPLYGKDSANLFGVFRKALQRGERFVAPPGVIIMGFEVERRPRSGELLYNGIRLPREWPPRIDCNSEEPMPVPYLAQRPEVVPIDVGRQLFVDDFLIEQSDFEREYHYPEKFQGNPILKPETEIEKNGRNHLALAAPKSGGLWWNPEKQLFELWYEAGWVNTIAYATSPDGLHWDRPALKLRAGTNQVLPPNIEPDSWTIVRDYRATDPRQKYKIFLRGAGTKERARSFVSPDGIDWGECSDGGVCDDRSTMFYNPFRKKWVYSLRWNSAFGRARGYWEADDFQQGMQWLPDEPVPWARTDRLDPPDPEVSDKPSLYNLDAVAYESIMLGFYQIFYGPSNEVNAAKGVPKNTGLSFAYSRDGFHWHRPDRKIAIKSELRDTWDRGYVQSLGNLCSVRGDKLWFYYIGFAGDTTKKLGENGIKDAMDSGLYANGATGVAFLRRDGFVSLNSTAKSGFLTTRPVTFSGSYLFANVDAPQGCLYAEILDMDGNVIAPFSMDNCIPITGDTTISQMRWKGGDDLSPLAHRSVRFRFKLDNGKFYAFWVSRDQSGRSDGYVAGGGPGFTSDVDTVGKASIEAEKERAASLSH